MTRDIGIHIVFDSAVAAFERIIQKITAIGDIELWAVATDQCGYVSTEWLVYSYTRADNRITKHAEAGLKREKANVREPKKELKSIQVNDISGKTWDDFAEFDFSISY
jgi:hypothetical protein